MRHNLLLIMDWLSGNVVGPINEVTVRRAGLVLRWVTVRGYISSRCLTKLSRLTQPGHPSWVGVMSTGDGFGYRWEETEDFALP